MKEKSRLESRQVDTSVFLSFFITRLLAGLWAYLNKGCMLARLVLTGVMGK